ncbi:MAG: hypothetical protein ACKVP0_12500 [Pirellulaceae bacterium]
MGYEKVAANLGIVHKQIADLKIKLDPNAQIVQQLSLVREYLAEKDLLSVDEHDKKWKDRFLEFYKAQLAVGILSEAIAELVTNQKEPLAKYLKVVLAGNLTQGGPAGGQPRDWFYELWLASILSKAGFTVRLQEPDLVVEGNGLSQEIGIACKYPSSDKGIHDHLSKGLSQLKKHGLSGFIALGIDQIVVEKANLKKFVDFNQGDKHPIDVLQAHANSEAHTLVKERPTKYPSEDPVDALLVTLSLAGHYGQPPQLVAPTVFSIHCPKQHQLRKDMEVIVAALEKLQGR